MGKRIREYIAKLLIISGITIFCGSIGACENGDYTVLQCVVCVIFGSILGLAGVKAGKEA